MGNIKGELSNVSNEGYTYTGANVTVHIQGNKIESIELRKPVSPTELSNTLYLGRIAYKTEIKDIDTW